jgi:hypothetical protein
VEWHCWLLVPLVAANLTCCTRAALILQRTIS